MVSNDRYVRNDFTILVRYPTISGITSDTFLLSIHSAMVQVERGHFRNKAEPVNFSSMLIRFVYES